jgi:hypothetical protein
LVKIYTKKIRRKYKRSQDPYVYPKYLVPVSASYNELIMDFLKKPLEEKITVSGETMHIMLTKEPGQAVQTQKPSPQAKT